jgi:hypothetical protein
MPGILVVVFWCWFAVSVGILVRRTFRRVGGGRSRPHATGAAAGTAWPTRADLGEPGADGTAPVHTPAAVPAPEPASTPSVDGEVASIADALRGIRMPCDLAPLTGPGIDADFTRRAAFYTVGYPPEAVAPEIADELERLGMHFDALTDNTAVARRDDVRVRVVVHAVGASVNGVAHRTYPTAPENSVVVEFELT